jgi:hypothetical protein
VEAAKINLQHYRFGVPQFILPQKVCNALGLKTPLWTSEEAADMPDMLPYLIELGVLIKL